ncbi:MAG: radical SAM protein [Deltaproteobacteria bacterium]|nr:radical SAM protein [Deltaproteobacteria bacterium]
MAEPDRTDYSQRIIDWLCDKVWPLVDSQKPILTVQLDITNACNLLCDHCYLPHHKNYGALTHYQWLTVLDQYERLVYKLRMIPAITICGGEPLLAPFLIPFLQEIRRRFGSCDLSVQSNGTLITDEVAKSFKELDISVQVSIDGPDAARHDLIRGQGNFEKAMIGCRLLGAFGVPFYHQAVLSRRTVGWIRDFFTFASANGATVMGFTRLIVAGYAEQLYEHRQDHPLVGHDLRIAMETILQCSRASGIPTNTSGALWHLIDPACTGGDNVGFAAFVIGYRGEFKVTSRAPLALGNVLEEGMEALFLRHPTMQHLRSNEIESCGQCPHFLKCRGDRNVSYAAFGHFFGPDIGCWLLQRCDISKDAAA